MRKTHSPTGDSSRASFLLVVQRRWVTPPNPVWSSLSDIVTHTFCTECASNCPRSRHDDSPTREFRGDARGRILTREVARARLPPVAINLARIRAACLPFLRNERVTTLIDTNLGPSCTDTAGARCREAASRASRHRRARISTSSNECRACALRRGETLPPSREYTVHFDTRKCCDYEL